MHAVGRRHQSRGVGYGWPHPGASARLQQLRPAARQRLVLSFKIILGVQPLLMERLTVGRFAVFSTLAGVDPKDPVTIDGTVHDIDGASFPSLFLATGNRFRT